MLLDHLSAWQKCSCWPTWTKSKYLRRYESSQTRIPRLKYWLVTLCQQRMVARLISFVPAVLFQPHIRKQRWVFPFKTGHSHLSIVNKEEGKDWPDRLESKHSSGAGKRKPEQCSPEKRMCIPFFPFLLSVSSAVIRGGASVNDFSLHLLLAHWPGRRLWASRECSLSFQGQLLERVHGEQPRLPFVKTFQWIHWQVVFKRARRHSWKVSYRAKCS